MNANKVNSNDLDNEIDKILINGDLNNNLIKVMTQVCLNLQKQFDIAPVLVNNFINGEDFIKSSKEINSKFAEQIKEIFENIEQQYAERGELRIGGESELGAGAGGGWNSENCAHVVREYPNGYKKYCNQHKYMHGNTTEKTNHGGFLGVTDHEFVFKTVEQIREEKILSTKLQHYQEYLNKLLELLYDLMINKIRRNYTTIRVNVDEILGLNDWLKMKKDCFKTRFTASKVVMSDTHSEQTQQYKYGAYIDLYLPNSTLEEYLKEIKELEVPYSIV